MDSAPKIFDRPGPGPKKFNWTGPGRVRVRKKFNRVGSGFNKTLSIGSGSGQGPKNHGPDGLQLKVS